ncbi:uncharacterized protein [Henckelia pumila]|uniref:uncharacterized protein n=1 Tax=Henckelia pumila TaxID=405737 RepID=UPI003C6E5D12
MVAMVLWSLWHNRNDVVWNARSKPATSIYQATLDLLSQWKAAHDLKMNHSRTITQQHQLSWQNPVGDFLKCNVDAAIFNLLGKAGYGCIIRNNAGLVVAAIYGCLPGIKNPSIAKAMAIREALSWIKDLRLSSVIVESDAFLIVDALNSTITDS